ncbi:LysM peptidoglycan-binding domain-containing protein [Antarctobacter sp.]|uniref:LysM peptidoglycan-binding domain-containing protein n=1 Tax=Antarctobacter sp. TaxID=1872577 RepID=UPI002B2666AE|nr:LysM peptidoglycan-binding domain-containing protein [Antarctobacter sp.]
MIRLTVLTVGFIASTAALLWSVGETPQPDRTEEVSRARPDTLSLQPATILLAPSSDTRLSKRPEPAKQVVASLTAVSRSLRPKARPTRVATPAPAEPPLSADGDDVMNILRAMSYGIVEEMKKPAQARTAPVIVSKAPSDPVRVQKSAPQSTFAGRSYTVQPGDSLPGVAFRFYGTTVAYLEILEANRGLMDDPSDLRAGMTLRIPDLN